MTMTCPICERQPETECDLGTMGGVTLARNIEDYPLCLNVKQAAEIMGLNHNKVYEMTHSPEFPCLREGKRIIIPRDAFWRWLNNQAVKA